MFGHYATLCMKGLSIVLCMLNIFQYALRIYCNWWFHAVRNIWECHIKFKRTNQSCSHSKISQSINKQLQVVKISFSSRLAKFWSLRFSPSFFLCSDLDAKVLIFGALTICANKLLANVTSNTFAAFLKIAQKISSAQIKLFNHGWQVQLRC